MPEIADPAMTLVQLCAGAFLLGVFFTIGAVAGLKLGTRWFGPINITWRRSAAVEENEP